MVLAELVERYRGKRPWARDLWYLASSSLCMVSTYTLAALLCQQYGLCSLSFRELMAN